MKTSAKPFDVVIVGGGLIGVSIAFELAAEKLRVAVLDRQEPGREASWAAAGMLSAVPESENDAALVPLKIAGLKQYPEFASAIEAVTGKSAAFVQHGALEILLPRASAAERDLRVTHYRNFGIAAEASSTATHNSGIVTGLDRAAIWLPEEATVEPRPLFESVLAAAEHRGVDIQSGRCVTGILFEDGRCAGVSADNENIYSEHVVVAAGCFSAELLGEHGGLSRYAPTRPVRGQMIALHHPTVRLESVLRSEHGYLVPRRNGQIVAGSTSEEAGFEKRTTPQGLRKIMDAAIELVPGLADAGTLDTWCGLRPGTSDDLPILGPTDIPGLLIATGHYRNGILLAPITARLMRDWIVGSEISIEAELFSPMRFAAGASHATT